MGRRNKSVFNLRWCGIAAVAAFAISLTLGISVRAHTLVVLLRALGFAVVFFFFTALVWRLINRYLPELLQNPSPQDTSLMPGLEAGSRVDITVGDAEIPRDAAVPPEESADESVGNIAEIARAGSRGSAAPPPAAPSAAPPSPPPAPGEGMDQSPPSRYTQEREVVPAPANPAPKPGLSGLGDFSGGVESLPDLDALAGTFLSSGAAVEEAGAAPPSPSAGEYRSKKGQEGGEDFHPQELASAIQTILKRD
ncbi:MAG: hypothetical protein LBO76_08460 [Treponema sp.]|nr:hypothetical protein [Treponema sp.]